MPKAMSTPIFISPSPLKRGLVLLRSPVESDVESNPDADIRITGKGPSHTMAKCKDECGNDARAWGGYTILLLIPKRQDDDYETVPR